MSPVSYDERSMDAMTNLENFNRKKENTEATMVEADFGGKKWEV